MLKVLLLGATSLGLKTVLCRQILKASAEKRQSRGGGSEALYTIVPALVNVLRNKNTSASVRLHRLSSPPWKQGRDDHDWSKREGRQALSALYLSRFHSPSLVSFF